MDRNSIIVLVVCFVLLMLWYPLVVNKLYPPKALPRGTNAPSATVTGTNQVPVANAPVLAEATTNAPRVEVNTNVPEDLLVISNENARYTFTSHGGGLKLIELVKYPETVSLRDDKSNLRRIASRRSTISHRRPRWPFLTEKRFRVTEFLSCRKQMIARFEPRNAREWFDHRKGLPVEHELPRGGDCEAGKPFRPDIDATATGMDCGRDADGTARCTVPP